MRYFDTHSHLNLEQFDSDHGSVIARMGELGVGTITVGTQFDTSWLAVDLAMRNPSLYAIVGHHPIYINQGEFIVDQYRHMLEHPKTVGVGECGFDFFRLEKTPQLIDDQENLFRQQIELALEYDKPLMLHIRSSQGTFDAYEKALEILGKYSDSEKLRGQAHFFAGDVSVMQEFVQLGFYISFTGVVTFARQYDEVVRAVPTNRLLAETDAPYVTPEPYRGTRCEPWQVIEVYKKMAEIRGEDEGVLREQINKNITELYKIPVA